jgi:hypothetical protein
VDGFNWGWTYLAEDFGEVKHHCFLLSTFQHLTSAPILNPPPLIPL